MHAADVGRLIRRRPGGLQSVCSVGSSSSGVTVPQGRSARDNKRKGDGGDTVGPSSLGETCVNPLPQDFQLAN